MIFVIDTSSAMSAVALLEPSGRVVYEDVDESGPTFDLPSRYRALEDGPAVTRVAVATGPGSFTGLRVGVSFGLGLAIGLQGLAVNGFCQYAGTGGFTHAPRTAKQKSMRQVIVLNGIF